MKRTIIFVLAAMLISPLAGWHGAARADTPAPTPAVLRLVVIEAPADFSSRAAGLGFKAIEKIELDGLGITAYSVTIRESEAVNAVERLETAFPGAIIELGRAMFETLIF